MNSEFTRAIVRRRNNSAAAFITNCYRDNGQRRIAYLFASGKKGIQVHMYDDFSHVLRSQGFAQKLVLNLIEVPFLVPRAWAKRG